MGMDAVFAIVGDANGYVNHFLGERIELAWRHYSLYIRPNALKRCWIICEHFPEVIDPVSFSRRHYVVIDNLYVCRGIVIVNHFYKRHSLSSRAIRVLSRTSSILRA